MKKYTVSGIQFRDGNLNDYFDVIVNARVDEQVVISSVNFHGLYVWFLDVYFRRLNRNSIPHIDGTVLLWLVKFFFPQISYSSRVSIFDLMVRVFPYFDEGCRRIFILGYSEDQIKKIKLFFSVNFPNISVECFSGYFDIDNEDANRKICDRINDFKCDMLMVGMGMGRQEKWIVRYSSYLDVPVTITVGAYFELVIGDLRIAPKWLSRMGLEGGYRLITTPRRVWKRYIVEPPIVIYLLCRRIFRYKLKGGSFKGLFAE